MKFKKWSISQDQKFKGVALHSAKSVGLILHLPSTPFFNIVNSVHPCFRHFLNTFIKMVVSLWRWIENASLDKSIFCGLVFCVLVTGGPRDIKVIVISWYTSLCEDNRLNIMFKKKEIYIRIYQSSSVNERCSW